MRQILLTLRTENTRALPADAIQRFVLPFCNGHILMPDPGYGSIPIMHSAWGSDSGMTSAPCTVTAWKLLR